jgi:hypothetical protein
MTEGPEMSETAPNSAKRAGPAIKSSATRQTHQKYSELRKVPSPGPYVI